MLLSLCLSIFQVDSSLGFLFVEFDSLKVSYHILYWHIYTHQYSRLGQSHIAEV